MISKMSGHTIVCGSGLMAQAVVERLQRRNIPVVVVTPDAQDVDPLQSRFPDLAVVVGDATNELVLGRANVWTAEHVIAATDRDVDNLLIGISCKDLGRPLTVIARSESPQIANRMRKAGVDEVICPVDLIGQRVSEMIPVG